MVTLHQKRIFTFDEANGLVSVLNMITDRASIEVQGLLTAYQGTDDAEAKKKYNDRIDTVVTRWQRKIEGLGGSPKGLWLADFPKCKDTVYCWRFPETSIGHEHPINGSYGDRTKII